MKIIKEIGRNPHIDWITIIFLTSVIAIVLAIGGIYLYNAVTKGDFQDMPINQASSLKKLDEKALSLVIKRLSDKDEISRKVKAGYTGPSDPSL